MIRLLDYNCSLTAENRSEPRARNVNPPAPELGSVWTSRHRALADQGFSFQAENSPSQLISDQSIIIAYQQTP